MRPGVLSATCLIDLATLSESTAKLFSPPGVIVSRIS